MKAKGLTGFFEDKEDKEDEKPAQPRIKGTGKFYHVTLRLTYDQ
jgi:hypothetical protein